MFCPQTMFTRPWFGRLQSKWSRVWELQHSERVVSGAAFCRDRRFCPDDKRHSDRRVRTVSLATLLGVADENRSRRLHIFP